MNENEDTHTKTLSGVRGKFIVLNAYINKKEEERSQTNNLIFHLKTLGKKRAH